MNTPQSNHASTAAASHTPGPWTSSEILYGAGSHGFSITARDTISRVAIDRFEVASVGNTTIPREAEANARLIAAAPELLEALKAVVDQAGAQFACGDRHATLNRQTIATLSAAISKATGRTE